jgi:AcrR family transcriptional regulator
MPEGNLAMGSRKARAAETEAALKEAAKRVFARVGYLRAKITDITAEAGRAAGSFYSHFDSKEQLLESLLVDMLAEGDRRALLAEHSPDFSDLSAIRWHIAQYWTSVAGNSAVILALQQAAMIDEHLARRQRELLQPSLQDVADHLEYVRAAGGRLPGEPIEVARMIVAVMSQYAYSWLVDDRPEPDRPTADEAVDMLAAFILHGIMGPPSAGP